MEKDEIEYYADRVIGTVHVLLNLHTIPFAKGQVVFEMIKKLDIKGSEIWILYKDVCKESLENLYILCEKVPSSEILKAAKSQVRNDAVKFIDPFIRF